jgi:DNA-binding HxlR family transcriptional regulator
MTSTHKKVGYLQKSEQTPSSRFGTSESCAALEGLRVLEGRWKLAILFQLFRGGCRGANTVMRFSALERAIPGVSQKMLIQQLRELERDGVVRRTVYPEVPPRVEYQLSDIGNDLRPVLAALSEWAQCNSGRFHKGEGTKLPTGPQERV